MKKIICGLFMAGLLASQSVVAEQALAFVDAEAAILNSEPAKERIAQLKARFAPDKNIIKELEQGIRKLQGELQQDAAVMSEAEKRKLVNEIETQAQEYQLRVKQVQETQAKSQQEMMAELGPKFEKAVKELMDKNDYNTLLHRKAALVVDPKDDITKRVTEKLNANP